MAVLLKGSSLHLFDYIFANDLNFIQKKITVLPDTCNMT